MKELWVEKYRPSTVDGYVFRDDAQKQQVKQWISDGTIPHLLFSGAAGIGKTTVCDQMLKEIAGVERAVTSTTREPRRGEIDTVDYYFFDHDTFQAKIDAGAFYEYAQVHNQLYGTLRSEVQGKLAIGIDLLLNIDVQGAAQMRETAQNDPLLKGKVITIFIMPPKIWSNFIRVFNDR